MLTGGQAAKILQDLELSEPHHLTPVEIWALNMGISALQKKKLTALVSR